MRRQDKTPDLSKFQPHQIRAFAKKLGIPGHDTQSLQSLRIAVAQRLDQITEPT